MTKRRFLPNLKKVTFKSDKLKRNISLRVTNAAVRSVDFKGGLDQYLKSVKKQKLSKKSISLPVSAPFHCQLMKPAAEEIEDLIMNLSMKNPLIPIVSNVTAEAVTQADEAKQLLIQQIYKRVRWREIIEYMFKNSNDSFVEIGPGKALSGMLKRFKKEIEIKNYNNREDLEL